MSKPVRAADGLQRGHCLRRQVLRIAHIRVASKEKTPAAIALARTPTRSQHFEMIRIAPSRPRPPPIAAARQSAPCGEAESGSLSDVFYQLQEQRSAPCTVAS